MPTYPNQAEAESAVLGRIQERFTERPELWQAFNELPEEERATVKTTIQRQAAQGIEVETGQTRPIMGGRTTAQVPVTRGFFDPEPVEPVQGEAERDAGPAGTDEPEGGASIGAHIVQQPAVAFESAGKGGLSAAGGLFSFAGDTAESLTTSKEQKLERGSAAREVSRARKTPIELYEQLLSGELPVEEFEAATGRRNEAIAAAEKNYSNVVDKIESEASDSFARAYAEEAKSISKWFREAREDHGEYEWVNPEVRDSTVGKFSQVIGEMAPLTVTLLSPSTWPLAYSQIYEGLRENERQVVESRGEDFDPDRNYGGRTMVAAANIAIERALGVERLIKGALKATGKKTAKDLTFREIVKNGLKQGAVAGAGEAPEEMTQGTLEDLFRKTRYDVDYDMSLKEFSKRRLTEAVMAFLAGGLIGTTTGTLHGIDLRNASRTEARQSRERLNRLLDQGLRTATEPDAEFDAFAAIRKPGDSSPTAQGATTEGAREGAGVISPSPNAPGKRSPVSQEISGKHQSEPEPIRVQASKGNKELIAALRGAAEGAPSLEEAVDARFMELVKEGQRSSTKAEEAALREQATQDVLDGAERVEIEAGAQTLRVPKFAETLESTAKRYERRVAPGMRKSRQAPGGSEARSLYQAAKTEGEREAALQNLSNADLKKLGLDKEYMRYRGAVVRREAVDALKSGQPGEVRADIATGDESGNSGEIREAMGESQEQRPEAETLFQRFALQLNEIVQLAQDLGKGRFPKILEIVKRNPDVRGVFRAEADKPDSGRIELKAGIFEVLTQEEIEDAKSDAFDMLYEAWLGEAEASGNAGMSPPSKDVFRELLESDKALQGRLKLYEREVLDATRREVAPEREPLQAVKTLAHEIGHWIDFLPGATMARGNILGRIANLHGYYKKMLPAKPTEGGELTNDLLSEKQRAKLRRQAMKQAGDDKMKGATIYKELLEVERKARGLITYQDVKEELEGITAWWRLGGDRSKLTDYHKQPEELYADAFSVLVNAPHELEQRAPVFFNAFEAYLSKKREAAEAYEKLQREVREGTSQTAQVKRLRDSLSKESAILTERDGKVRASELWDGFTSAVLREFQPFYRRAKRMGREAFKKSQSVVSDYLYRATEHELYLTHLNNEIMGPLSKDGITMEDFDEFLFHRHIIENRYNIANPLGWTAKTSTDRLAEMQRDNPERFDAMERAQFRWWKLRKEQVIEPLRGSKIFADALTEKIEQQAFYTPFKSNRGPRPGTEQDIESLLAQHYGRDTGLRIAKQIGQLGEVKSPTNQLMAIDLRLMDFVKREAAKQEVVKVMQATDAKNIMEAETRKVRVKGRMREEPVEVENSRVGTLYLMKGGDVQGYYLPKALTVPFNRQHNINAAWYSKALYHMNTWQKSLFTQLNPGFWPVAVMRDVFTRYRKMPSGPGDKLRDFAPVGVVKDAAEIAKAFPSAWRSVRGASDADAELAMRRGMVISRRETIGHGNTFKGADIERALMEFDKDPRNFWSKRHGAEKKVSQALSFWLSIGQAFERAPKIATMKYLDENFSDWPEWKKRNFVRQHGGSPDFLQRGTIAQYLDMIMLFHNPAREGWMSEPDAAVDDPKGYWMRGAQMAGPRIAFKLAGLGVMGTVGLKVLSTMMPWIRDDEEMQEMFRSISQYDLVNYDCIPLFWADREAKKVFYLRLPTDETTRILVGSMMQPALEDSDPQDILNYMGSNVPGQHPLIGLLLDWRTYALQDQNPYDNFLQRPVIDPMKFKAGEGTEDMLWHTWNDLGGSIIKRGGDRPTSFTGETKIEKFLDLPIVQNVAGRWFKVSNYGQRQRIFKDSRVLEAGKKAAKDSLMAREIMDRIADNRPLDAKQREVLLYSPRVQEKVRYYLNQTVKRSLGPEMEAIDALPTKEEKAAAMEVISGE